MAPGRYVKHSQTFLQCTFIKTLRQLSCTQLVVITIGAACLCYGMLFLPFAMMNMVGDGP